MAEAAESPTTTQHSRGLRGGSLSIWEAVGISIALMAPSMAATINPVATRVGSGLARHEGLADSSAGE